MCHRLFQIPWTSPSRKKRELLRLLVFLVLRCEWNFSALWLLARAAGYPPSLFYSCSPRVIWKKFQIFFLFVFSLSLVARREQSASPAHLAWHGLPHLPGWIGFLLLLALAYFWWIILVQLYLFDLARLLGHLALDFLPAWPSSVLPAQAGLAPLPVHPGMHLLVEGW